MRTLALVATGGCPMNPEILQNWQSHVSFLLLKGKQTNKQFKVDFLEQLANALVGTTVEGYLVCSVLARKFSLSRLLKEGCMNTLLLDFEMNLVLTLICKALKLKEHLPMLAFYRAMIYLSQGIQAHDSDKQAHERALEDLQYAISARDRLNLGQNTRWFEQRCQLLRQQALDRMKRSSSPAPAAPKSPQRPQNDDSLNETFTSQFKGFFRRAGGFLAQKGPDTSVLDETVVATNQTGLIAQETASVKVQEESVEPKVIDKS